MKKQAGFTLIELIMVIVILGILAATAIPKYYDLSGQALTASKQGMSGAVKAAQAIFYANAAATGTARYPTITELAAEINPAGTAAATGVTVVINGTNYTVPTYSDATCATPTTAVTDTATCVGDIP